MNAEFKSLSIREQLQCQLPSQTSFNNGSNLERKESSRSNSNYSRQDSYRENQRRVVSLDSSSAGSRESSQTAFNNNTLNLDGVKKRSYSAGMPSAQTLLNGANNQLMHPLRFEEVDLKLTPLSSNRSCSEYQKACQKVSSNSSWLGRSGNAAGDLGDTSKSTLSSLFSYLFRSKKRRGNTNTAGATKTTQAAVNTGNDTRRPVNNAQRNIMGISRMMPGAIAPASNKGVKKEKLKVIDEDERSFFVESMTKRDDEQTGFDGKARKRGSFNYEEFDDVDAFYRNYTPAPAVVSSSSSKVSRHRPTKTSSFSSTYSSHSSASIASCMPGKLPTGTSRSSSRASFSSTLQSKQNQHRKSIEDSSREENMKLQQQMRRRYSYDRGNSFLYETSAALDMLFGFRSSAYTDSVHGMPMEIELKTIKTFGSQTWYISSDGEINATRTRDVYPSSHSNEDDERNSFANGNAISYVPFGGEFRGGVPRSNLAVDTDSPHNPNYGEHILSPDGRLLFSPHGYAHSPRPRPHNVTPVPNVVAVLTPLQMCSRKDFHTWLHALIYLTHSFCEFCKDRLCRGPADEFFYEQLRIQPFGFGAYLRCMLWAGFSSLFFTTYSLVIWPSQNLAFANTSVWTYMASCVVFGYLCVQAILNLVQLPLRIYIHFQCWESSRTVDVDFALLVLRSMLQSDVWAVNRFVGRVQDGLSIAFLVASEYYLQTAPGSGSVGTSVLRDPQHTATTELVGDINGDPLYPVIVSICASTLLALTLRVGVATCFALSCHDPTVLAEARRRGLSRLDIDVLPTFVFSDPEEINNHDCCICLCEFDRGDMLISLPCGKKHSFHANCIRTWLQRQNSCPLCQRMV
jgi:hypothetical protein